MTGPTFHDRFPWPLWESAARDSSEGNGFSLENPCDTEPSRWRGLHNRCQSLTTLYTLAICTRGPERAILSVLQPHRNTSVQGTGPVSGGRNDSRGLAVRPWVQEGSGLFGSRQPRPNPLTCFKLEAVLI